MTDPSLNLPSAGKSVIDEAARKARAAMVEILTHTFDKSTAYTNLIMLGGYGGAFTLWNFTRDQMSARGAAAVATLITASLFAFVSFEIYKMIHSSRVELKQRALIMQALSPDQFLAKLEQLRVELGANQLRFMMPIWYASVVAAVSTALIAVVLLFYSFFATLFGWPHWP